MKRIVILLLSVIAVMSTSFGKTVKLTPAKTIGGLYAYKDSVGKWASIGRYKDAGYFSDNGLAAISFDGMRYALMNEYECLVTDLIFDGKPQHINGNLVVVYNPHKKYGYYLASIKGERLTRDVYDIKYQDGIIIVRDTNFQYFLADGKLNPLDSARYQRMKFQMLSINQPNFNAKDYIICAEEASHNSDIYIDVAGDRILPKGLYDQQNLATMSFYWSDKIFKGLDVKENIINLFFAAKDEISGKYGIYFIDGRQILPPKAKNTYKACEYFSKNFKKKIYPLWASGELQKVAEEVFAKLRSTRTEIAAANLRSTGLGQEPLLTVFDALIYNVKVDNSTSASSTGHASKGKKSKNGKRSKGKVSSKTKMKHFSNPNGKSDAYCREKFTDIIDKGIFFFCRKPGSPKYYLYNMYGIQMSEIGYDEIQTWRFNNDDDPLFKVRNGNKWGIINGIGEEMLTPQFSEIGNNSGVLTRAKKDNHYYVIDAERVRFLNNIAYDFVDKYDLNGKIDVERQGFKTKVTKYGKEEPSIPELAFRQAERLDGTISDKIQAYAEVVQLCGNDDREVKGAAYCNIGYYYAQADDMENAKKFYKLGVQFGSKTAADNLNNIKRYERVSKWQAVGNALNVIADGVSQITGNSYSSGNSGQTYTGSSNSYQSNSGNSYSSSSNSSGSSSGRLSESYYRDTYQRWERSAKSIYESLTLLGSKITKNGQDASGSNNGSFNLTTYNGLKQNLRNAQSNMRKTRFDAQRDGYTIPKSNYEDVTVSY